MNDIFNFNIRNNGVDNPQTALFYEFRPSVQGGKACFKGTRIPVASVEERLKEGDSPKEIVKTIKKYFKVEVPLIAIKCIERDLIGGGI